MQRYAMTENLHVLINPWNPRHAQYHAIFEHILAIYTILIETLS